MEAVQLFSGNGYMSSSGGQLARRQGLQIYGADEIR
jgi:hypothetical protein